MYTWILSNYPWSRLSVRIIGAIKRQFFHMVTHIFDNSNLSQEIFAIDTWRAVICSLGHGRKHMLTILPTIWRSGLKTKSDFEVINRLTIPPEYLGLSSVSKQSHHETCALSPKQIKAVLFLFFRGSFERQGILAV